MMIPDPLKKTVKIPIRIVDGKAQYFHGGPFPKTKNVVGDLVIPAYAVTEAHFLEECSVEFHSKLLPAATRVIVNVWAEPNSAGLVKDVVSGPLSGNVEVQLLEPLYLRQRGTKKQ
jgi:hypothetical protein